MGDTETIGRRAMDGVTRFIRDVGFPIFITCYFLFSLGPKFDRLADMVERQTLIIETRLK